MYSYRKTTLEIPFLWNQGNASQPCSASRVRNVDLSILQINHVRVLKKGQAVHHKSFIYLGEFPNP